MCDLDANRQQNCLPRMQLENVFEKDESIDVCFIPKEYVNRKCGMLLSRRTWLFPLQQHLINYSDRLINYMKLVWRRKKGKNSFFESYSHTKGKTQKKTSIMGIIISVAMETSLQTQYLHVSTAYYHLVWLYIIETIVITLLGWKNARCHGNTVQCS